MDFSNRSVQHQPAAAPVAAPVGPAAGGNGKKSKHDKGKWSRIGVIALLSAIVIILVALITLTAVGAKPESKYVDNTKLQAVFLNTGQVYFGNVKALNDKYFVLTNIYYLQTSNASGSSASSSTANSNVTLVKLGCELHQPYDQMVINSDQVTFWENLQDSGQVAKAVKTFQQQNPNGQKCADQSSSSSSTSGSSVQSAPATSTPATTPATTSTNP